MNDLFDYALRNVRDGDMLGITIHNEENQNDKPIRFSFRRKDQISGDVTSSVFEKVVQSNARFNVLDKLVVVVHSVKMPVGFGHIKIKGTPLSVMAHLKIKGTPLSVMAHLKRRIVEVKAEKNCLAHALIIAIAN